MPRKTPRTSSRRAPPRASPKKKSPARSRSSPPAGSTSSPSTKSDASPKARSGSRPPAKTAASGDARAVLESCLDAFEADVAATARAGLEWLRGRFPGAIELVYDAYNALSIPFAAGPRLGQAFVSVVVYPRHVNLGFLRGAELEDPHGLLQGDGSKIRHLKLDATTMDDPRVLELVETAAELAGFVKRPGAQGETIIQRIYPRQRPRRPASR